MQVKGGMELWITRKALKQKAIQELWWPSSLVQQDFWASLFNRALLVYSADGQIISGQNLVVPDSAWYFVLDLV